MFVLKSCFSFSLFLLFSLNVHAQLSPELANKSNYKLINVQETYRLTLIVNNDKIQAVPADGFGLSRASAFDFMAVNYRDKTAGVYIFLNKTDKVLVRQGDGSVVLKKFGTLTPCQTEAARWEYAIMMTGGSGGPMYNFSTPATVKPPGDLGINRKARTLRLSTRAEEIVWEVQKVNPLNRD